MRSKDTTRRAAAISAFAANEARRNSEGKNGQSYSIEVLNRAIDILSVFTPSRPALGLSEVVGLVGLPKTTVFRILNTLVERGLCDQDPDTGRYSLGFRLMQLADVRRRQFNLRDISMPVMREIRDAVGETVVLSIRAGDYRFHIDFAEGLHPMRRMADPGRQAPLYAGAAGKVFLAGMDNDEIEDYLRRTPLRSLQKNTITKKAVLMREIALIRERGFGESQSELLLGGGALAAPIKDYAGATVGVIDILTAEGHYTKRHREQCIKLLLDGVRRVSERLGYAARS
jgi:DNA-binding IclR family transcriptional regulator